jgi:hypothetical protein
MEGQTLQKIKREEVMNKRPFMDQISARILPYLPFSAINGGLPRILSKEKPLKECLLPGCSKMTRHNGGYCSAEHCKEHRQIMRRNR